MGSIPFARFNLDFSIDTIAAFSSEMIAALAPAQIDRADLSSGKRLEIAIEQLIALAARSRSSRSSSSPSSIQAVPPTAFPTGSLAGQ